MTKKGCVEALSVRYVKAALRQKKSSEGTHEHAWAWEEPEEVGRDIKPGFDFQVGDLGLLLDIMKSLLHALGHLQIARASFGRVQGHRISPDGNLGGFGYVQTIKGIRQLLGNCEEGLSSIIDTLGDEVSASHWHPVVEDSEEREKQDIEDSADAVREIRQDPEGHAQKHEEEDEQKQ